MSLKDFVVMGKLGQGTFATVYKARRLSDQNLYAIKKIQIHSLDLKSKNNSLNEVRLLASFNCNNIITYHETIYDQKANVLYLVMEYADGGDLLKLIQKSKKEKRHLPEIQIWKVLLSLIHGLQYLHERNILHRDVKSENIFISNETYKIGDLNVSKVKKNDLKQTQTGTPYYASPEVWNDQPYDEKSDIWSLGCVLYEMATFRPPFMAGSMEQLYQQVTKSKVKCIPKQYSNELFDVILQCLQKNPQQRPTAKDLLNNWTVKIYENLYYKKEDLTNIQNSKHISLLKTINMSMNSKELKKQLPKANYSKDITTDEKENFIMKSPESHKRKPNNLEDKTPSVNRVQMTPQSSKRRSLPRTEKSAKKVSSFLNEDPASEKKPMKQSIQAQDHIKNILLSKIPKTQSRQSILKEMLQNKKMKGKNVQSRPLMGIFQRK